MGAAVNVYSKLGPKITRGFLQSLEDEGVIFDSKGIWLTFEAEGLRGMGIYISSLKRLSRGRLITTKSRFIAIAGGYKIIDIPKEHKLFHGLTFDRSNRKRYKVNIDLSLFGAEFAGNISLAYHISPELVIV